MYKKPELYVDCKSIHYVESFNTAILIYHDKRIVFESNEYKRHSLLATLEWNENVDRGYTSVTYVESMLAPRRNTEHKNSKEKTFNFWAQIREKLQQNLEIVCTT